MTRKQEQFAFFFKNAGYSYDPKSQTPKQGRAARARKLAEAERYFDAHDWRIEWWEDWTVECHVDAFDGYDVEPETCEQAILYDAAGNVLASLGCIDDADDNYRRVIRAELALEAMADEKDVQKFGLLA